MFTGADLVTLTQAEFDHILETIGELSLKADVDKNIDFDAPLPPVPVTPTPAPSVVPPTA